MGDFEQALSAFDRVLEVDPNHAVTWNNRGNALYSGKCYLDALLSYDKALSIWPDFGQAKTNRANTLKDVAKSTAAEAFVDVLCSRGADLMEQQLYKDALACFDDALAVRAGSAAALAGREHALKKLAKESCTSR
jgi:tetratricopeptide (TPR) repeat protein